MKDSWTPLKQRRYLCYSYAMRELFKELNDVAAKVPSKQNKFFKKEFFEGSAEVSKRIVLDYKELESNSAKEKRAYDIFEEIFNIVNGSNNDKDLLNLEALGEIISQVCEDRRHTNCKLLVSLINSFPWTADNGLTDLLSCVKGQKLELIVYLNDQFLSKGSEKWSKDFWASFKKSIVPEFFLLTKPNIFLECSTGFSQIIMTLNLAFEDVDRFQSPSYYAKQLSFVMGKYKLDPIRCLDLILLVSSFHLIENHEFVIELLKNTQFWPSPHLRANCKTYTKLNHGGNPIATRLIINRLNDPDVELQYIDLVVHLIENGFVPFAPIFECLSPSEEQINRHVENLIKEMESDSLEGSLNPLAMAAALPDEAGEREPEKEQHEESAGEIKGLPRVEEDNEALKELVSNSCKWKLVERMMCHGNFACGLYALEHHQEFFSNNDQLISSLLELFNQMLNPLANSLEEHEITTEPRAILKLSHNGISTKQDRLIRSVKSLEKETKFFQGMELSFYNDRWVENLSFISTNEDLFYYSHMLFPKLGPKLVLCPELIERICSIAINDIKKDTTREDHDLDKWVDYFRKFLLPVLGIVSDEQFISNKLFCVLRLFPFEKRYFFYNELSGKIAEDNLLVKLNFKNQEKKMRSLLKSLSIDNISSKCRTVANLVSCNPLSTLPSIIKQIENYDKVAELIVKSAEFFSDFGYDTLQYVLLIQLSSGRPTLQEDGITRRMWISRLSLFIAGLARICNRMDMSNIFLFMIKNIHKESALTLAILKELIIGVAGIQTLYDVNWNTLLMLNSGEYLKELGRNTILDFRKKNLARSKEIVGYLMKFNAVSEMIIMLINLSMHDKSDNLHFKILSTKCDEATSLLWAFIELLKLALNEEQFKANVLPFDVLINRYDVPVEWAFNIWRDYFDSKLQDSLADREELIGKLYSTNLVSVDLSEIRKDLFFDFWRLSLYDIRLESSLYEDEKATCHAKVTKARSYKDRSMAKRTSEIIQRDFLLHKEVYAKTHSYLQEKSSSWFPEYDHSKISCFLQFCVLPRLFFSPPDAIYSATFINDLLRFEGAFEIFKYLIESKILGMLLFSSTVNEASNLAIFFREIIKCLERARKNTASSSNFVRKELFEFYTQLIRQVILMLQETNYMSIRNSIQFLNVLSESFPVVDDHVEMILDTLELLLKDEQREDIKLPANALKGHLRARLKNAEERNEFYELSVEEQHEEQKVKDEMKLIKKYADEKAANEEKRKRKSEEEQNKQHERTKDDEEQEKKAYKRKEQSDKTAITSRYSDRSTTPGLAPFTQTIESVYRIERLLKDAEYQRIIAQLQGAEYKEKFQKILTRANDVSSFRNKLKDFFREYFNKLLKQRPEHSRSTFDIFLNKCNNASLPNKKASRNMYEDDNPRTRSFKRSSEKNYGRNSGESEPLKNRASDLKENTISVKKAEVPRIPTEPKKGSTSRYQLSGHSANLPKGPANLVKTTSGTNARQGQNPASRFQGTVPSGPKNDSVPSNSPRTGVPPRRYGSPTVELQKRPVEDDNISNRFGGNKRQRKNDRSLPSDSLPQGPRKPATGSRFNRG